MCGQRHMEHTGRPGYNKGSGRRSDARSTDLSGLSWISSIEKDVISALTVRLGPSSSSFRAAGLAGLWLGSVLGLGVVGNSAGVREGLPAGGALCVGMMEKKFWMATRASGRMVPPCAIRMWEVGHAGGMWDGESIPRGCADASAVENIRPVRKMCVGADARAAGVTCGMGDCAVVPLATHPLEPNKATLLKSTGPFSIEAVGGEQ